MKIFFLLATILLSLASTIAVSASRSENVNILIRKMGVEQVVKQSIAGYKAEILRQYPDITEKDLDEKYGVIFEKAGDSLIHSYEQGFDVYTDDELVRLVDFYNTEFGRWFSDKETAYNQKVQINFEQVYKQLNNDFINRTSFKNPH
ncbi:MAG: DUF2059 domain-containing protein [Thermodesulfobacteriota bacterium]